MTNGLKKLFFISLIFTLLPIPIFTQSAKGTNEGDFPQALPYEADEFHPILQDMWRVQIISVGIFPFMYLASSFVYDIGRFTYYGIADTDKASEYAPLFFAPPNKPTNTQKENQGILISSIFLSVSLGILDRFIDYRKGNIK